jgi:hypothetical protein
MKPKNYAADHPYAERMSQLAESFPALNRWGNIPGIRPWNPHVLAKAVSTMSHGEACAARFVLAVWSGKSKFPGVRAFDLFEAMGVWDSEQVEAAIAWMQAPFWP